MSSVAAWLPFVRATAIGWVPLCKSPMPMPFASQDKCSTDSKLIINVSGFHFETWKHTVERFPDTLLGSDEKEYFFDPANQEYFFDRNPYLFRYVLAYYKTGKVHFPRSACAEEFEQEMAFFGLMAADSIGDCCYEEFKDRKKDSLDLSLEQAFMGDEEPKPLPPKASFRQRMRHSFEYPHSNTSGLVFYYVTGFFIAGSVLANILETVPCPKIFISNTYPDVVETNEKSPMSCGEAFETELFCVDTACVIIFSMEYILRLYASSDRFRYATSVMSVIDAIAILPYYVGLTLSDKKELGGAFVTLRVFRVFRVFKFSRHSQGLRILGYTLKSCARELGFLLFSLTMAVVIFATVIYYTEKNVPKTEFTSIPEAFWYTIVTMTTLGYGDMVPKTFTGKLVGGICSLSGVLVIALPVPVIVSNFSRIYQQSQRSDKQSSHRKARQQQLNKAKAESLSRFMANQRLIHHKLTMQEHHLLAMKHQRQQHERQKEQECREAGRSDGQFKKCDRFNGCEEIKEIRAKQKSELELQAPTCTHQTQQQLQTKPQPQQQQHQDKYLERKWKFLLNKDPVHKGEESTLQDFEECGQRQQTPRSKKQLEVPDNASKTILSKNVRNFLTPDFAEQQYQQKQLEIQKLHEQRYLQQQQQSTSDILSHPSSTTPLTTPDFHHNSAMTARVQRDVTFDQFQLQHHHLLVCLEKSLGRDMIDSNRFSSFRSPPFSDCKPQSSTTAPLLTHRRKEEQTTNDSIIRLE